MIAIIWLLHETCFSCGSAIDAGPKETAVVPRELTRKLWYKNILTILLRPMGKHSDGCAF